MHVVDTRLTDQWSMLLIQTDTAIAKVQLLAVTRALYFLDRLVLVKIVAQ